MKREMDVGGNDLTLIQAIDRRGDLSIFVTFPDMGVLWNNSLAS